MSNDHAAGPVSPSPPIAESSQSNPGTVRPKSSNQRSSSVRFSREVESSAQSTMSNRRAGSSSDEITPIRQADDHAGRGYNTSNASDTPQPQTSNPPSKAAPSSSPTNNDVERADENTSWLKRVAEKYGSVSLENKGSVARDHLALERTFLAWLRTSLAFASIGIAITQLFRLNTSISSRQPRHSPVRPHTSVARSSNVPFSPYLGHAIPSELLPYLQQIEPSPSAIEPAELGSTLLDQLLLLSPSGASVMSGAYRSMDFDEGAAAKLRSVGKPLGATFLGISVLVLLVGFHRYFEAQYWIIRGKFPASRGSIALIAFMAGALTVASLIVVLAIAPKTYER